MNDIALLKLDPNARLMSLDVIRKMGRHEKCQALIVNAIGGEMSEDSRYRKMLAIFEEAYLHIATADPDKLRPKLLGCTQESFLQCLAARAMNGLTLNRIFQHSYLVPFKGVMTIMAGYRGLIKLATNTDLIRGIRSYIVYEGDEFHPSLGTDGTIHHEPKGLHAGQEQFVEAAYAIVTMKNGAQVPEITWRAELDKIRASSKAGNSPAYKFWCTQMWRKAPIRRACNYIAMSSESEACTRLMSLFQYEDDKFGLAEKAQIAQRERMRLTSDKVAEDLGEPSGMSGAPACMNPECTNMLDHTTEHPFCSTCQETDDES